MNWYDYPVTVPFNNPNYDVLLGGSHDLDVGTPPNTPITAILAGKVSSLTFPQWGIQLGIALDKPYNGAPFMAFLHLAAIRPGLVVGSTINPGDLIAWSGGCNYDRQYDGSSNPTGQNFTNSPKQSSQPQTGIALMRGPEYGVGEGWTIKPDTKLDPTSLLDVARVAQTRTTHMEQQMLDIWNMFMQGIGEKALNYDSGIANSWKQHYATVNAGSPLGPEQATVNWSGRSINVQYFSGGLRCEWDNTSGGASWYDYLNRRVI